MGLKNLKEVLLKRFLGNFEGILQTDGYAAYGRRGGPTIGACGMCSITLLYPDRGQTRNARRSDLARMLHRFPVWSVCPDDESSQAAERD